MRPEVSRLLCELDGRGVRLRFNESGTLCVDGSIPEELRRDVLEYKQEIIREMTEQKALYDLRVALLRLEYGETAAVRIFSRALDGQLLLLKDDDIPESVTVNCPTFTLVELRQLIGTSKEHLKALYLTKLEFPGTETVDVSKVGGG